MLFSNYNIITIYKQNMFSCFVNRAKALRRESEQSAIGGDGCVIASIKTKKRPDYSSERLAGET